MTTQPAAREDIVSDSVARREAAGPTTRSTVKRSRRAGRTVTKTGGNSVDVRVPGGSGTYGVRVDGHVVPVVPFRIEVLIQMVGSLTGVADLLGVAKSQPTRWRKGEAVPSPDKARLLNDLEHVFSRAALIFEPEVIHDWMTGSNSYLQGARPIDVLHAGRVSEVVDALDAAEQLAYGG